MMLYLVSMVIEMRFGYCYASPKYWQTVSAKLNGTRSMPNNETRCQWIVNDF
jgi:hypothetical protein